MFDYGFINSKHIFASSKNRQKRIAYEFQPFTFVSLRLKHPVGRDKQSYSTLLKMCLWKWGNKEFCEEAFFACRQSFRALDPHLPIRQSLVMFEGFT